MLTAQTCQAPGSRRCCCDEDSLYNPKPDKNGDYWSRNLCDKWIVVDQDGPLNGRMDFKFPFSTYDACNVDMVTSFVHAGAGSPRPCKFSRMIFFHNHLLKA